MEQNKFKGKWNLIENRENIGGKVVKHNYYPHKNKKK